MRRCACCFELSVSARWVAILPSARPSIKTRNGSRRQARRLLVRSGDVISVDFGIPVGSTPAKIRPAIVVTADQTLRIYSTTLHVVPLTTNVARAWTSDVRLDDTDLPYATAAQCHLCAVIDSSQILSETGHNIGGVQLAQVRSVIADLLDLP